MFIGSTPFFSILPCIPITLPFYVLVQLVRYQRNTFFWIGSSGIIFIWSTPITMPNSSMQFRLSFVHITLIFLYLFIYLYARECECRLTWGEQDTIRYRFTLAPTTVDYLIFLNILVKPCLDIGPLCPYPFTPPLCWLPYVRDRCPKTCRACWTVNTTLPIVPN